jgi:DNA polymerase-3 subunit alpha
MVDPILPGESEWDDESIPPPPDEFPFGWEAVNGVVLETISPTKKVPVPAASTTAPSSEVLEDQPQNSEIEPLGLLDATDEQPVQQTSTLPASQAAQPTLVPLPIDPLPLEPESADQTVLDPGLVASESAPQSGTLEKPLHPIVPPQTPDTSENIRMVTVILRPRADKVRDKLLLRRIFGLMISQPGNDRFALHIFERGRGHLLEFPNLTTNITPELINRIAALVGADNIRVEPITFQ